MVWFLLGGWWWSFCWILFCLRCLLCFVIWVVVLRFCLLFLCFLFWLFFIGLRVERRRVIKFGRSLLFLRVIIWFIWMFICSGRIIIILLFGVMIILFMLRLCGRFGRCEFNLRILWCSSGWVWFYVVLIGILLGSVFVLFIFIK